MTRSASLSDTPCSTVPSMAAPRSGGSMSRTVVPCSSSSRQSRALFGDVVRYTKPSWSRTAVSRNQAGASGRRGEPSVGSVAVSASTVPSVVRQSDAGTTGR